MKVLVIDNIDSFVYNLVQYLGELSAQPVVYDNTTSLKTIREVIEEDKIEGIVISPGPKRPEDAGVSNQIIAEFGPKLPLLGVCLGHQCIGQVYGGTITRAEVLKHGKMSWIEHDGKQILKGMPNPFEATRYHSLVIEPETCPDVLEVSARSRDDGQIMGVRHRDHPVWGLQFHPESIATLDGKRIIKNFLGIMSEWS